MRALIIGPDQKAAIAKVVAHAMEPDHFYHAASGQIPGDDPNFVAHVPVGFRCVFTLTKHGGKLFRHLTVSVPDKDRFPSPEAMIALAREFGFTTSDDSFDLTARLERDRWLISEGHEGENCMVAVQPID
jgi:hypothetical protein